MCFPVVILVICIQVFIIILLLLGLVLSIPVAIGIFFYNLFTKNGFRDVTNEADDAVDGNDNEPLEVPPEIESSEAALFQCDLSKTNCKKEHSNVKSGKKVLTHQSSSVLRSAFTHSLTTFQHCLGQNDGKIDLTRHTDVTHEEFGLFAKTLLSLNRRKYPFKMLILDNCELTDEKLSELLKLIIKFEYVTINGYQKITDYGWEKLSDAIINSSNSGLKLRKIQLKVTTKKDNDRWTIDKDIFLEEFGRSMTDASLSKISQCLPFIEKVYLDDVFSDNVFTEMFNKSLKSSDNLIEAWKDVARQIRDSDQTRKLRCLSLPGCAINDDIMTILAPELVKIKAVHLGRNPINIQGWKSLKHALIDEVQATKSTELVHLSLSMLNYEGAFVKHGKYLPNTNVYLHSSVMAELTKIILKVEEVNLSGQQEIGHEGWKILCETAAEEIDSGSMVKLKTLKLDGCKIKPETRELFEMVFPKPTNVKLDFGDDASDGMDKNQSCMKCCV